MIRLGPLTVEQEDDGYWVVASSSDRVLCYGEGPTLPRALWDYLVSLRDLWQTYRAEHRRRD